MPTSVRRQSLIWIQQTATVCSSPVAVLLAPGKECTAVEVSDGDLAGGVQVHSWGAGLVTGGHGYRPMTEAEPDLDLITAAGSMDVSVLSCGWTLSPLACTLQ